MRVLRFFLPLIFLASPTVCAQCECLWRGSFTDVQAETDLVVSGTVVAKKGNSIDVGINRNLRGADQPETIRVWLKAEDYCRPEPEIFPIGSDWVMALHRITENIPGGFNPNTPSISYGRPGDYSLSSCGGYWLNQSDNLVTGNLVKAPRWERQPPMTPVLLDLIADFVQGNLSSDTLLQASKEDPALRELILDTRSFLRNEN
jgi:hypothetical protein